MSKSPTKLLLLLVVIVVVAVAVESSSCPTIKLKRQWGGKPATGIDYQVRPIRYVVVHHTVTDECNTFVDCAQILQNIQSYNQRELDLYDINYNFLIGNDGVVYEGTGWGIVGAHTYGYNANGTGIAFIGNYIKKLPSRAALDVAKQLLKCGVEQGELSEDYALLGGSQVIATQSPGLTLYNEIQEWPHWVENP